MYKLQPIVDTVLKTRRSKEERGKNHVVAIQKQIQQYIKDGSKGNLDLRHTPITSLPDNLKKVGGWLDLGYTPITTLPIGLVVGDALDLSFTKIPSLPDGLEIGGELDLTGCKITELPPDLTKLPSNLTARYSSLKSISNLRDVGGWLDLQECPITELPDGLKVGGILDLYQSGLTSLPRQLSVGIRFTFNETPLAKKLEDEKIYTEKQLKDLFPNVNWVSGPKRIRHPKK